MEEDILITLMVSHVALMAPFESLFLGRNGAQVLLAVSVENAEFPCAIK